MQTVELVVARGKTVVHDRKRYGPGEKVTVAKQDAETLIARGFAHREGETPVVAHVVAMKAIPEGMTEIGRVSEHHAFAADRGRFFTQR